MISAFIVTTLIAVFLLIMAGTVTMRFIYQDEPIIIFDFLLLQFQLFPSRKKARGNTSAKKERKKKAKSKYRNLFAIKRALDFLLIHSDLKIKALVIRSETKDPARLPIYNGYIDSLVGAFIAYLLIKSPHLITTTPVFSNFSHPDVQNPTIDISLHTPLHVIAFTFIIYSRDKKRKRERKIVGNKNE